MSFLECGDNQRAAPLFSGASKAASIRRTKRELPDFDVSVLNSF
jgi:hypothetical protein